MTSQQIKGRLTPKEEITLRLSVSVIIKGMQLVESGRFDTFDQVVEEGIIALSNDKRIQEPRSNYFQITPATTSVIESEDLDVPLITEKEYETLPTVSPIDPQRLAEKLLPITVQRLLPIKFCLCVLASEIRKRGEPYISNEQYRLELTQKASKWRKILEIKDKSIGRARGERLSSTFPTSNSDIQKSLRRFFDSIVGYQYIDGRQSGAFSFLGFASISVDESGNRIGITDAGFRFAKMYNPIINGNENIFPPFSEEERAFLFNHILERSPMEAAHIVYYMKALRDNQSIGRKDLMRRMRVFYERLWNPLELTNAMVDSLRGGVNGRCVELGLAQTKKEGKTASYVPTELGLQWIERIDKKIRA